MRRTGSTAGAPDAWPEKSRRRGQRRPRETRWWHAAYPAGSMCDAMLTQHSKAAGVALRQAALSPPRDSRGRARKGAAQRRRSKSNVASSGSEVRQDVTGTATIAAAAPSPGEWCAVADPDLHDDPSHQTWTAEELQRHPLRVLADPGVWAASVDRSRRRAEALGYIIPMTSPQQELAALHDDLNASLDAWWAVGQRELAARRAQQNDALNARIARHPRVPPEPSPMVRARRARRHHGDGATPSPTTRAPGTKINPPRGSVGGTLGQPRRPCAPAATPLRRTGPRAPRGAGVGVGVGASNPAEGGAGEGAAAEAGGAGSGALDADADAARALADARSESRLRRELASGGSRRRSVSSPRRAASLRRDPAVLGAGALATLVHSAEEGDRGGGSPAYPSLCLVRDLVVVEADPPPLPPPRRVVLAEPPHDPRGTSPNSPSPQRRRGIESLCAASAVPPVALRLVYSALAAQRED